MKEVTFYVDMGSECTTFGVTEDETVYNLAAAVARYDGRYDPKEVILTNQHGALLEMDKKIEEVTLPYHRHGTITSI
jgi:hypothetical protein